MTPPSPLQRLLAELQRRKVFRAAAVYGAGAFAVLQAADILLPALGLPEQWVTWIAGVALAALPLVLALAWTFERTGSGLRQTGAPAEGELEALTARPASARWPVGLAAVLGVALLTASGWLILGRGAGDAGGADATDGFDSIAVLPFANLSGVEEDEYLGDGLSEELMYALTRIDGLNVAARTSAFAFKGSTAGVRAIADSLGVATVLQGSVRRSEGRLRITAQLTRADTGFELWTERYDRPVADLLAIQDDLTRRIIDALQPRLEGNAAAAVAAERGTDDPDAYDAYLQGRYFWNKRTGADMEVARRFFREALDADPDYALALAALADSWAVPVGWGDDTGAALNEADRYARAALELDPTLAEAHTSLAFVHMMRDLDFVSAEESFLRALDLDPLYATAHQWYAELLVVTGRRDEAVERMRRAVELDPTEIIRWNEARVLYFARRYDDAIRAAEALASEPGVGLRGRTALVWAMSAHERRGEWSEFLPTLARIPGAGSMATALRDSVEARGGTLDETLPIVLREHPEAWFPPDAPSSIVAIASADAVAETDPEQALERLATLLDLPDRVEARTAWFEMLTDPVFDEVRALPGFAELDRRIRE